MFAIGQLLIYHSARKSKRCDLNNGDIVVYLRQSYQKIRLAKFNLSLDHHTYWAHTNIYNIPIMGSEQKLTPFPHKANKIIEWALSSSKPKFLSLVKASLSDLPISPKLAVGTYPHVPTNPATYVHGVFLLPVLANHIFYIEKPFNAVGHKYSYPSHRKDQVGDYLYT